jgi:glycosyltransferase involved in cell wall biosynthesis/SAM-dependent methyltransferase
MSVHDPEEFLAGTDGFDAAFYHLGNNPYHEFVYRAARKRPEIAVFHDVVLHHLVAHETIEQGGDPGRYEAILHAEYGHLGTRLAMLRQAGLATDFEKFLFPLTGHVASRARGIVVHSEDSAVRLRDVAADVPVAVIPHHAGAPPAAVVGISREEARGRLGLPPDAFLVGHFGFITRPKQPAAVVAGFAALAPEFPKARLLMVGADHTGGALGRLVEQHGIGHAVHRAGYVDLVRFYLYLKAVDVVVNLRYPTAGETSGTFARSLAEGRAVIVNNYGSFAEVPGDVALKVEIDQPQGEQVGAHLLHLARDPAFRAAVEERARRYADQVLDPRRCRDLYIDFAREVGSRDPVQMPPLPRVRPARAVSFGDTRTALQALRGDVERLWGHTLPATGTGPFLTLLYRLVLGRPAEDAAARAAHAELFGPQLTRPKLVERILDSREFRELKTLEEVMKDLYNDPRTFTLQRGSPLGPGTTERLVEIPWMLSRWQGEPRVLDVGYAYALGVYLMHLLQLGIPELHGVDMATLAVPGIRRAAGDIRRLPYRDGVFDLVYCISTIEHIGRDNTGYGLADEPLDREGDVRSLREMARILAPHGRLLISVPFGRREERGWFQQYDTAAWEALVASSPLEVEEQEVYRLTEEGWVYEVEPRSMELLSYGDGVPAARGVLCAVLVRTR